MATIDDKLKLFTKVVLEKVQKDSEQRINKFTGEHDKYLKDAKEKITKESEEIKNQTKKKAEAKKNLVISRANIDGQRELLEKKKELFDHTIMDIRKMAEDYTSKPEYADYLEKCIKNGLSRFDTKNIIVYLKPSDISNLRDKINKAINKYKAAGMVVTLKETTMDIIGGCVLESSEGTMRVDCSMSSVIEGNRGLIGRELIDNLQ